MGRWGTSSSTTWPGCRGWLRIRCEGLRGFDWADTGSKPNGVAWLELLVLHRPILRVEDDYGFGERERRMLDELGLASACCRVNVTEEPGALPGLHQALRRELSTRAAQG